MSSSHGLYIFSQKHTFYSFISISCPRSQITNSSGPDMSMGKRKDIRTVSPTALYQGHLGCIFTVSQPEESCCMFQPFLTAKGSSSRHIFCKWKFTDNVSTFLINLSPLDCRLFKHRSKTAYLVSLPHILPALGQFNHVHQACQPCLNTVKLCN